jgi:hypothetical protein
MKRLEGTCRCGSRRRRIEVNKSLSLVTVCELLSVELNESFSILYASDCGSVKYIYLYWTSAERDREEEENEAQAKAFHVSFFQKKFP